MIDLGFNLIKIKEIKLCKIKDWTKIMIFLKLGSKVV